MPVKIQRQKLVRIIDILKGYVPSVTIIANKILLKTIEISIGDCLVYMLKVIRLFFKPLLVLIAELY